jgi:hypothetical protein
MRRNGTLQVVYIILEKVLKGCESTNGKTCGTEPPVYKASIRDKFYSKHLLFALANIIYRHPAVPRGLQEYGGRYGKTIQGSTALESR